MLETIGVPDVEALFRDIPTGLRFQRMLDLPPAATEATLRAELRTLAEQNADLDHYPCFLGAGAYDRLVPAAVRTILSRSEFYTAYTPYQAEISQGVLQSIYEFQTMICELTGLDVANASVYDGASAVAEGAIMACAQTGRTRIAMSAALHPEYRQVTATYLRAQGVEIVDIPWEAGRTDLQAAAERCDAGTAALIVQQPNFFGGVEDLAPLAEIAHRAGAMFIVSAEPICLGLLRPPGETGADIAVGEGQPLGNAISFGGPYLGYVAAKRALVRRLPGRIVGATVDDDGRRGYVLTLQAREQHIRREKASSNICTNQALNALAATAFLALVGPSGLRRAAELSLQKAHYAWRRIAGLPGFTPVWPQLPFVQEFAIRVPVPGDLLNQELLKRRIIGGLPLGQVCPDTPEVADAMLFCVTEARTKEEIDGLVDALAEIAAAHRSPVRGGAARGR